MLFNLYFVFNKGWTGLNIKYLFSILTITTSHLRFDTEKIANNELNELRFLSTILVLMYCSQSGHIHLIRGSAHFGEKIKTKESSFGPRQANFVVIAYASSEGSGEPAHARSLARTFAARSYKQWVKRNLQTESQIPDPSQWLGMRN